MIIINKHTETPQGERLWSGIQLVALAKSRRHHFYKKQVDTYIERGFAEIKKDKLYLNTVDGKVMFNIDHAPGTFCLHCGEIIALDKDGDSLPQGSPKRGANARKHIEEKHKGKASPNPSYPAGYKVKNYYGVTADDSVPTVNPKAPLQRMRTA